MACTHTNSSPSSLFLCMIEPPRHKKHETSETECRALNLRESLQSITRPRIMAAGKAQRWFGPSGLTWLDKEVNGYVRFEFSREFGGINSWRLESLPWPWAKLKPLAYCFPYRLSTPDSWLFLIHHPAPNADFDGSHFPCRLHEQTGSATPSFSPDHFSPKEHRPQLGPQTVAWLLFYQVSIVKSFVTTDGCYLNL